MLTKFHDFGKSSQFPLFFQNDDQISQFLPKFTVLTKFQLQGNTYNANNADYTNNAENADNAQNLDNADNVDKGLSLNEALL